MRVTYVKPSPPTKEGGTSSRVKELYLTADVVRFLSITSNRRGMGEGAAEREGQI